MTTLTADRKKRVVIPGAAPGDVFAVSKTHQGLLVKRIYHPRETPKKIEEQLLNAIKKWKVVHQTNQNTKKLKR